jgi:enamine deaminase RidA (YjgF/YER057c/UK114 family)
MQPILHNDVARPGAKSVQGMLVKPAGTRLILGQQYGLRPDGLLEKGLKAQLERAWINVFAVIEAAGFKKQHIVKTTTYVTEPGRMLLVREIRDRMLEGHSCLSSCFQVSALQLPSLLCEIEVEAIREP